MAFGWSRRRGAHGGATPARMRRELAQALDVLTADAPLVLVLEDLQWSDRSTVDLLAHLAQRGRRGLAHGWPAAPPTPWRRRPQKLGGWRCPAALGGAALVVSAPVRRCGLWLGALSVWGCTRPRVRVRRDRTFSARNPKFPCAHLPTRPPRRPPPAARPSPAGRRRFPGGSSVIDLSITLTAPRGFSPTCRTGAGGWHGHKSSMSWHSGGGAGGSWQDGGVRVRRVTTRTGRAAGPRPPPPAAADRTPPQNSQGRSPPRCLPVPPAHRPPASSRSPCTDQGPPALQSP
jgi:hypothetical protein